MTSRNAAIAPLCLGLSFGLAVLAGPLWAGPYGVTAGVDTPASLGCFPDQGTFHNCLTLPAPSPDIYYYKLQYHESLGYCLFMGVGFEVASDQAGSQLKAIVEIVAAEVAQTFGPGTHVDLLHPASQLLGPDDWMKGVLSGERSFGWLWELATPIDGISLIAVAANGITETSGNLTVEFHTPVSAECDALDRG